ncbi:AimR family lysis-lysogeny pheromone receptor [Halobacillus sp. A5]|uniref:AimR family lysis-lysogeny pheromone receptor n=1 Tax=Halobacillus sp. A5 TaxID=2880263 RepID=UPI0020A69A8E|nr:AimR family lysis-lysogeny pheromone receptor [Halobacillus sp. A5]MCP3027986.1 AimR family lysis-lysogeny pheromone receptor [Halobacillus sp. A5]
MNRHTMIEPTQLIQGLMNRASRVYEHYHFLLQTHSSQQAAEFTKDFCLNSSFTATDDQLACFEFLYMNDFIKELDDLLHDFYKDSKAFCLYKLLLKRRKQVITLTELKDLESLTFNHPSLQCLHLYVIIYLYYDLKMYTALDKYTDHCYNCLHEVREPLFYYFMNLRFDELSFHHYWKTNNLILARKYAFKYSSKVIAPRKLCSMHHNLSLSYVFENYRSSMHHAQSALQIALQHNFKSVAAILKNNTIPFIAAFHKRTKNVSTTDLVETAHIAIAENKWEKASGLLTSLNTLTPFQESYLGLAERNPSLLINAHQRFLNENGDLFFAILPKLYLKRLNQFIQEGK